MTTVKGLGGRLKYGIEKPEFKARDGKTYCNMYVSWVLESYGYMALRGLLATQILQKVSLGGSGWERLSTGSYERAAGLPLNGCLVLYASPAPAGSIHGHVSLGAPEYRMEWSPKWGMFVPMVASCGKTNHYGIKLSMVFSTPPEAFVLQ